MRRIALDIKKEILQLLKKNKEMSLRELESKINTNNKTIRSQVEELEYFGFVKIIKHEKNEINGRPYTTIVLISNSR